VASRPALPLHLEDWPGKRGFFLEAGDLPGAALGPALPVSPFLVSCETVPMATASQGGGRLLHKQTHLQHARPPLTHSATPSHQDWLWSPPHPHSSVLATAPEAPTAHGPLSPLCGSRSPRGKQLWSHSTYRAELCSAFSARAVDVEPLLQNRSFEMERLPCTWSLSAACHH
jgi:hypothetical protein